MTTRITTKQGMMLVLPICSFVLLFEIVPTTNISTCIGPAYIPSNIDNTATSIKRVLVYQSKYSDEHNIGYISDAGLSIFSSSQRRDRNNNFENNGKDDNDTYLNGKGVNRSYIALNGVASNSGSNSKLVHSSFRLEQHVIESLENVAARRGMSLSALVNKVLKNYVTSEMYFEELGFLLVSKNFLRRTFEVLDQKDIADLGRKYGLTIAKEYVSYFYPQVNSDTLVQFLDILFRRFQSFQHRIGGADNNLHYFIVNHGINMNFTLVLQYILEGLIEPIIMNTVEFTNITPCAITFSFRVQKNALMFSTGAN